MMTRTAIAASSAGPPDSHGYRLVSLTAPSYNAESRTVEAVLSSGTRVNRGFGIEELAINVEAIDLSRIAANLCPLLNAHNRFDIGAVLGVVESARIERNQLLGRIRFADTAAGREAEGMVARGELAGISIGYAVRSWQLVEVMEDGSEVWRAANWELLEVSLAPVPADPTSFIRSEETDVTRTLSSTPTNPAAAPLAPAEGERALAPPAPPARDAVSARAIMTAVRNAGLDVAAADELIATHEAAPFTRDGLTAEIGRRYAARDSGAVTRNAVSPYPQHGGAEQLRTRMEGALFARLAGRAPDDASREFMGASMTSMARGLLEARGENVRWLSDGQVMERAMNTTSDFPTLLMGTGNRYLLDVFQAASSEIKAVARQRTARDFRDITIAKLSQGGLLDKVGEGGEIHFGSFTEGKETYRLSSFAKIFALSRQAIINDDLGAFSDPLRLMARAAAETEAQELAALLEANGGLGANMGDGKSLYHADHGNKAVAGGAIDLASLSAGRQAMRDQKDADGVTPMNAVPKYLLVGTANETLAEQQVAQLAATQSDRVNPFTGKLIPKVDPRLSGNAWRLFADPAVCPVIEYAYLESAPGPQLVSREGWNVLGMEFRVINDFGCAAIDWRGTYYNAGQ